MLTLIFTALFGILIATFAVQNRNFVDLRFGSYLIDGVPVYLVVLGSVLLTLIFAAIIYFVHSISASFTLFGKDKALKNEHNQNLKLEEKVRALENENARLREKNVAPARPIFS